MSDFGSPEWRARNRKWLQSKIAPADRFMEDYIYDPLNKAIPGQWGDNLQGLLEFSPELTAGADIRDQRDGLVQIKDGVLAADGYEALHGLGLYGLGVLGMAGPLGDVGKQAGKEVLSKVNDLDDLGFYSPTERLAANLQPKGTGQQYLGILAKGDGQGSRIAEEMQDMGLDTWLQNKGKVSRDEVLDYIGDNRLRYDEKVLNKNTPLKPEFLQARAAHVADELELIAENEASFYTPDMTVVKPEIIKAINIHRQSGGSNREARDFLNDIYERAGYRDADGVGYIEALEDQRGQWVETNTGLPHYQKYSQKGGTDYQENLLTVPHKVVTEQEARGILGASDDAPLSQADIDYAARKNVEEYTPPHYDGEPNLALTTRTQSFNTPDGKSVHLMDELQSDWHKEGKKKGYKDAAFDAEFSQWEDKLKNLEGNLDKARQEYANVKKELKLEDFTSIDSLPAHTDVESAAYNKFQGLIDEIQAHKGNRPKTNRVPNVPAKKSWINQGIKKELNQTIKDGKEYFAWTGGGIQADRYSLRNQIDSIGYEKRGNLTSVNIWDKDGKQVYRNTSATPEDLERNLGKDMAEKILKGEKTHSEGSFNYITDADLEVGGEGMKSFYDKDVRKRTEKIIKRLDPNAKVEVIELDNGNKVWGVKITDKMRGEVQSKGMPLYSIGGVLGGATVGAGLLSQQEQQQPQGVLY